MEDVESKCVYGVWQRRLMPCKLGLTENLLCRQVSQRALRHFNLPQYLSNTILRESNFGDSFSI